MHRQSPLRETLIVLDSPRPFRGRDRLLISRGSVFWNIHGDDLKEKLKRGNNVTERKTRKDITTKKLF